MSDKKKILVIQSIHKAGIDLLENHPNFDFEVIENLDTKNIISKISECDALSIRTAKLPGALIDEAKNLQIISRHGVGYDNIDTEASKRKNITLTITANSNAVAVAEHVMFMLLNISKRKEMYDSSVKSGRFDERNKLPKTIELWNKSILIAGFGRIGQCLIKRCKGFEMKVKIYDPFINKKIIEEFGGQKIENLEEGLKNCDYLSLHVPLNKDTKNLIDYSKLKNMKKEAIVINTARGGIINEDDLNKALNENIIFGAGLDVFEKEPIDKNNPLLSNKKMLLSPHSATFTDECKSRMSLETTKNIIDFFDNKIDKSMIVKL